MKNSKAMKKESSIMKLNTVDSVIKFLINSVDKSLYKNLTNVQLVQTAAADINAMLYLVFVKYRDLLLKLCYQQGHKVSGRELAYDLYGLLCSKYYAGSFKSLFVLTDENYVSAYTVQTIKNLVTDSVDSFIGGRFSKKNADAENEIDADVKEMMSHPTEANDGRMDLNGDWDPEYVDACLPTDPTDGILAGLDAEIMLSHLQPIQREVIRLRNEGYSANEVAEMLPQVLEEIGCPHSGQYTVNYVNVIHHRACNVIRKLEGFVEAA